MYNEAGEVVKTILVQHFYQPVNAITLKGSNVISSLKGPTGEIDIYFQGTLIGIWDGTNANGDPASNGVYNIKVDNVDSFGVETSTTQQAMVSRSLYKSTVLIYNEAGEIVRHLYAYVDDPGLAVVSGVQLSTDVIQPGNVPTAGTPSQVTILLSNGTSLVWDGRGDSGSFVESGQYFLEIHSVDGTGGETTVTKQLSVQDGDRNNGVGAFFAKPNLVNESKGSSAVTFAASSAMDLTLRVSIYTLAGELVTIVQGGQGSNFAPWDAAGLASGLYLAVVEGQDANGGLVSRQILKVMVIR